MKKSEQTFSSSFFFVSLFSLIASIGFTLHAGRLLEMHENYHPTNLDEYQSRENNPVVRAVTSTSRSIVSYVQPRAPFSRHGVLVCFDLHGFETSIPRYRHAIFIR